MRDRYWDGPLAAFVLGIFCLVAIGLAAWSAGLLSEQRVQADRAASSHSERTDEYIDRTCVMSDRSTLLKCVKEAVETSHENQRSEYDLNAQENMGRWAMWLLIVSVFTTGVTGVGIFYVRETLAETRVATGVNREIGERQVRAYLDVTKMRISGVRQGSSLKVRIFIKNSGVSPARHVRMNVRLTTLYDPNDKIPIKERRKITSQRTVAAGESCQTKLSGGNIFSIPAIEAIEQQSIYLVISIIVIYEDVFGKTRRTIARGYASPECTITGKGPFTATAKHNRSS